jgi:hypothetical protein
MIILASEGSWRADCAKPLSAPEKQPPSRYAVIPNKTCPARLAIAESGFSLAASEQAAALLGSGTRVPNGRAIFLGRWQVDDATEKLCMPESGVDRPWLTLR